MGRNDPFAVFEDFQHAHGEMKTIEHLRIIGQELKGIAFRFISADMHEDLMIAALRRVALMSPKRSGTMRGLLAGTADRCEVRGKFGEGYGDILGRRPA